MREDNVQEFNRCPPRPVEDGGEAHALGPGLPTLGILHLSLNLVLGVRLLHLTLAAGNVVFVTLAGVAKYTMKHLMQHRLELQTKVSGDY